MNGALVQHIDELVRTVGGQQTNRDALIQDSWKRCVNHHNLDPTIQRPAVIVTDSRLKHHRDAMEDLLRRARAGIEALYRQVAGLGYVLLLTDETGITVDYIGDASSTDAVRAAGLYLGSDWNERRAGTCAVGTCIATQEALVVHQTDHFDTTHIPLTCTAAPIFDAMGNLAAVLDIAALASPEAKSSQFLALQIVKNYAHRIETANLISSCKRNWIVKLTATQEFAEVDTEFVLTLDSSGRIVGFNQFARQLLAQELRIDWRKTGFIHGRVFSDFFDCEIDSLTRFVNSAAIERSIVRLTRSGTPLFIQVTPPSSIRVLPSARARQEVCLPEPLKAVAGEDPAMQAGLAKVARLVNTNMSFLIEGETGTGKEFMAKAIHAASARANKPFIPVNCAALPESLIESELFGYEGGSFTGALAKGKKGFVREAHGGTLFLDEIGDMPLGSQVRLLRVLAEREVTPIGSSSSCSVDIRVIAATHHNLVERIRAGLFREDLYFRLNGAVITMPPLRERKDFHWLVARLLARKRTLRGADWRMAPGAREALHAYPWPGNIRELVNAIEYASAISAGEIIQTHDLPDHVLHYSTAVAAVANGVGTPATPYQCADAVALRETLRKSGWNISAAARSLGVDRTTLHRRMRRLGVSLPPRVN